MASAITPEREVVEALSRLKAQGLKLGLVSNCGPCVPMLWEHTQLSRLIDVAVFSCEEPVAKPSVGIYEITAHQLDVQPQKCIYVGDGSSKELTGAADAGMLPILKRTNLKDVYDIDRPEVANWHGRVIGQIMELPDVLSELER